MATIHLGIEPTLFGEKSVLSSLSLLQDEWHVFYSLGFLDRNGFDRQREIDYVAFHPERGMVFIEVKGGSVKFENGKVSQWLDNHWKDQNPVNQLNNARRVCLEYLSSRGVDGFIPARNIYVFPTTQRPETGLSQELDECSYFGDEAYELSDYLLQVASGGQSFNGNSEKLVELLTSCMTYSISADSESDDVPVLQNKTLSEILTSGGSTFTNVEAVKAELGAKREALQALWWKVVEGRSDLESKDGESKFHREDALVQIMRETSNLLNNSAVEIGVFGQVKRGKSTLVNALIGQKVSATGMMPKTAVPVTIEYSPEESGLISLSDGGSEFSSIENAVEATTQSERKRRIEANEPSVDRVIIRLPLDWLQSGVKLVDTPGLSDPANTDVYENFALAELDRVGAAIFVVCYPPGPEQHEVQLISSLASHGLAKIFFVVNTYSDIWKRKGARKEIEEYVESIIEGAASGVELHEGDRRVFVINLKMATDGQESGSIKKIKDSGLLELRENLEEFLSTGALDRIASGAGKRLMRAAAVIEGTLQDRAESIKNPSRVKQMRDELQQSIVESEQTLDAILKRVTADVERITITLESFIDSSYATTLNQVSSSTKRATLRTAISRLPVETATISSTLINKIQREMMPVVESARNDLFSSLNVSSWTFSPNDSLGGLMSTKSFSEIQVADYIAPKDYTTEARSAAAVIGAMLGGGGGIALAATGPLGLAIGGLIGWLLADSLKEFAQTQGNSQNATPQEVQKVISAVQEAQKEARTSLNVAMNKVRIEISKSLAEVRRNVLRDSQAELKHIEFLLSDEKSQRKALAELASFASELSAITGSRVDV
jgi:hypothetical protein